MTYFLNDPIESISSHPFHPTHPITPIPFHHPIDSSDSIGLPESTKELPHLSGPATPATGGIGGLHVQGAKLSGFRSAF